MPQIKEMIELAEKITSATSPGNNRNNRGPATNFCLDMGVVMPLYILASQCGDSMIRRKAIALLHSISRQEGPWNSFFAAKAAERIMEIEESGSVRTNEGINDLDRVRLLSIEPFIGLGGI